MDEATEITPQVYLGPLSVARDQEALKAIGITAVVCAAAEGRPFFPDSFAYCDVGQDLIEHTCGIKNMLQIIDHVWDFCEPMLLQATHDDYDNDVMKKHQQHRILVHCVHGRTRSAAVVVYLLARLENATISQAYQCVRSRRDVLIPQEWLVAMQTKLDRQVKVPC